MNWAYYINKFMISLLIHNLEVRSSERQLHSKQRNENICLKISFKYAMRNSSLQGEIWKKIESKTF